MLGVAQFRRRPRQLAAGLDEVGRIKRPAAVVALVAAGVLEATVRAGPFDVAVRQETLLGGIEELPHRLAVEVAVLEQLHEEALGDSPMVVRAGSGEEVEVDAEVPPMTEEFGVVAVDDLLRGDPLLLGFHRDRGAVHVGARDHQGLVSDCPVVAGKYVGRKVGARDMPEVHRTLRIGPGDGDQDVFGLVSLRSHEASDGTTG